MPRKLLVYLDQSYVSTIARQLAGQVPADKASHGRAMADLYATLARLVNQDKVICPKSAVHDQETDLLRKTNPALSNQIHDVLTELSNGRKFQVYGSIELGQVVRALRRYVGLTAEPEDGRWQHAYYDDPHLLLRRPRVYVRIPWPEAFAEDDRARKTRVQDFRADLSANRTQLPATFRDTVKGELNGVIKHRYLLALQEYSGTLKELQSGTGPVVADDASGAEVLDYLNRVIPPPAVRLLEAYASFTDMYSPGAGEKFLGFFDSPEFASIPYYDIFCSMEAGFTFYKRQRPPQSSDVYDFVALASVLPYVDVVTTDAAMKDMLVQLGLDKRYNVQVFSARQADVQRLIGLLNAIP